MFQPNTIIDYSLLLEYMVAYCGNTDTYLIFTPDYNDTTTTVVNSILESNPTSLILVVTDENRAKAIFNTSPQCLEVLNKINGWLPKRRNGKSVI